MIHGTQYSYSHYGCRCVECTEANRVSMASYRAARYSKPKSPDDPRHGKPTFYNNHGCRCAPCTDAWNEKCRNEYAKRRARRTDG